MIWVLFMRFQAKKKQQSVMTEVFQKICFDVMERVPGAKVRIDKIDTKKELLSCVEEIRRQGALITEWHVIGYGTSYGPLLGNQNWPEEISAYEWRRMYIPFSRQAEAWFYMDGADEWIAPFMASEMKIKAHGRHRLAETNISNMLVFEPGYWSEDANYEPIAALYAETFSDITVRRNECLWIDSKFELLKPERVLDIGCGSGALLSYLADRIKDGTGVDTSREIVNIAVQNNNQRRNLTFTVIDSPRLPFEDHTFDIIISMLSFRYLDWDPIVEEMKRVLAPGGHILIVDMLASIPKVFEWPVIAVHKLKTWWQLWTNRHYREALRRLVHHPDWRRMIKHHPVRTADKFNWYLISRFPNGEMKVLNRGVKTKIVAFDSGPVSNEDVGGVFSDS